MPKRPLEPKIQTNILKGYQFKLEIEAFPHVSYHASNCQIPGVTIDQPEFATPHRNMILPGSKITFDPFNLSFFIDDDLNNYKEIYYWLLNITFQDQKLVTYKSDMTLHILNGDLTPKTSVKFINAHPTLLSEISFDSSYSEPEPLMGFITMEYDYFIFDGDNPIDTQPEDLTI